MSEVAQHLVDGGIAPYRLRADGSFASIAATLLEAHRTLCETAIALAAAGGAGARVAVKPRVIAALPADHDLLEEVARAFEVAPELQTIVLQADFPSLPSLVKLLEPERVVLAAGCDPALDEAMRRAFAVRPEKTRFIGLGAAHADVEGVSFDSRLESAEAVKQWVGELARDSTGSPATGVEIALEIVTV
jgi:hypothetical protein